MTAIFYPDCNATSPSGKFTLWAHSPHNGMINHRNGEPPSECEFAFKYREHQSDFRYRLIDNSRGCAVWERWQERGEDSPHEVIVSDEGWSILRTHGFQPELIVVSCAGQDVLRIKVGPEYEDVADERHAPSGNVHLWRVASFQHTTAGCLWDWHSWRYFFHLNQVQYFAWRTSTSQYLVIDLTNAALLSEVEQRSEALRLAMRETETQEACRLLSDLADQATEIQQLLAREESDDDEDDEDSDDVDEEPPHPLLDKLSHAVAAIHLVGVHRMVKCVPLLHRLEEIDCASYSTGSTAMDDWWLEAQYFRPILHHTLRLLGEEPLGYNAYHFTSEAGRFSMPERVANRRELATTLNPRTTNAQQVLQLLGSPDHVRRQSHPAGKFYRWTEDWEYDFRVNDEWVTLRITFEDDPKGKITRLEEVPSPWLHSDERVAEILQH